MIYMATHSYINSSMLQELANAAYEALQIARDTGVIKRVTNETTKAIEKGIAKMVYIAEDVEPPEVVAHLPILCEERKVQYLFVPSKAKLGTSSGLKVSTAAACIVEPGDSLELVTEIVTKLSESKKR